MPQKLSAMKYIRNNKRRVAVLIVSLGLCFVLTYLTQFLLSSTTETFRSIVMENTRKIQYISLAGSSLGIDVDNLTNEEINAEYNRKIGELAEKLKARDDVKAVYYAPVAYINIAPAIGQMTAEMPLLPKEEIPGVLTHFGAKLSEGRLPENPGEVVMDAACMKNNSYEIGDYFNEDGYGKIYKIVGILDCDSYFGCGIPAEGWNWNHMLVVLSEGIDDMSAVLHEAGIDVRENFDSVIDYTCGKRFLKEEVADVIGDSTTYIYVGIIILLFISLTVVYMTYLRDRHNEWCLYCSIGFSRKEIYLSIIRELLFTFITALILGGALISVSVVILDRVMIEAQGLKCRYFYPETLGEIFCSYALLFGILQIPIRYALYRIRTIDAIDDDLY